MNAASSDDWRYGRLASLVYALDKPVGKSFGDVEFYQKQLADVAGPILEPAVGTGRILIPLINAGHDMSGFDVSEPMLAICQANCEAANVSPKLFNADMVTMREPNSYDAIVVPTGSIVLVPDKDAAMRALANMHDSLRPGGRLIIDVPVPNLSVLAPPIRHWWHGDDLITLQTWHVDSDPVSRRTTRWLRYELWQRGSLVSTELQLFAAQWFERDEFASMLAGAGFPDITEYGSYEKRPPRPGDSIWTFDARRG